jgi:hypothetical protein
MKRRRRARANPTGAQWLLISGAIGAVGVLGYLVYKTNAPAASLPSGAGSTYNVQLSSGSLPTITMSLSKGDQMSLTPPAGGALPTVTFSPTNIVGPNPNGAYLAYSPIAVGSTTCTVNYTDTTDTTSTTSTATGNTETATFTVNVTA